jgi:archaellum component FlaC
MADARLQIIIDALNNASDDLKRLKQELGDVSEATKKTSEQTKKSDDNFKALAMAAAKVTGAYFAVKKGAEFAYKAIAEGADLDYAKTRFDNLSASIGTTSDALLTDLRNATKGTRSDFELMASGADFMALGLAKTHNEAVRLTKVAGALGMNMNQLVLTLTNKTTMRFDNLGVSVDGFAEKVKKLEAAGLDADAAFKEAFLQQAEQQIARVGDRADTTAGKVDRLKASFENMAGAIKKDFAEQAVPALEQAMTLMDSTTAATNMRILKRELSEFGLDLKEITNTAGRMPTLFGPNIIKQYQEAEAAMKSIELMYTRMNDKGRDHDYILKRIKGAYDQFGKDTVNFAGKMTQEWADMNDRVYEGTAATSAYNQAIEEGSTIIKSFSEAMQTDWKSMKQTALAYNEVLGAINQNNSDMEQLNAIINGTSREFNGVAMSVEQARKKLEELKQTGADLEVALENIGKNVSLSMLEAALATGDYTKSEIQALTDYMVEAGFLSQEAANMMTTTYANAVDSVNRRRIQDKVANFLANTDDFDGKFEVVNGRVVDPKTGKVLLDLTEFYVGADEVESKKFDDLIVKAILDDAAIRAYQPPNKTGIVTYQPVAMNQLQGIRAAGGPVVAAASGSPTSRVNSYLWQEHGYPGEIFVPSMNGYILSRADAAAAVSNANTYNSGNTYHITSMNKPEPVLTLSQEMRIRATLEGLA